MPRYITQKNTAPEQFPRQAAQSDLFNFHSTCHRSCPRSCRNFYCTTATRSPARWPCFCTTVEHCCCRGIRMPRCSTYCCWAQQSGRQSGTAQPGSTGSSGFLEVWHPALLRSDCRTKAARRSSPRCCTRAGSRPRS